VEKQVNSRRRSQGEKWGVSRPQGHGETLVRGNWIREKEKIVDCGGSGEKTGKGQQQPWARRGGWGGVELKGWGAGVV